MVPVQSKCFLGEAALPPVPRSKSASVIRCRSCHLTPFRHTGPSPAERGRPASKGGSESFSSQLYCTEVSEVPGDRHFCGSLLLRPNSAVQPQSAHLPAACLPRFACLCVAPVCRCVATGRRRQGAGLPGRNLPGDLFNSFRVTAGPGSTNRLGAPNNRAICLGALGDWLPTQGCR